MTSATSQYQYLPLINISTSNQYQYLKLEATLVHVPHITKFYRLLFEKQTLVPLEQLSISTCMSVLQEWPELHEGVVVAKPGRLVRAQRAGVSLRAETR